MKSLAALLASVLLAATSAAQETLPNILGISTEDLSPHFEFYGDKTVETPNLSRLAREGVVYDKVFTTAGVCSPSRCAIITGMNQVSTGGHNMRTLLNTFPEKTGLPSSYSIVPPPGVKAFPEFLRAQGYYCTNNFKTDYQFEAPATTWDEVSQQATWRRRQPGQPFFAVYNYMGTHESQVWMRKNHPLHADPAKMTIPPYYPDTKTVRQDMARFMSNVIDLDSMVGVLLRQLEEDNLLDKTIVFFWSDHGDGLPNYKRELYDRGTHIPLVIRFPDKRLAGTRSDRLISSIDFAPTLLSLAGVEPPTYMQGRAFMGKFEDNQQHQYVYAARDRMDSEYDRVRAARDTRYRYVRNFRPELPRYQNVEYRLQQDMMKEMLSMNAAGLLNEVQRQWFEPTKPAEEFYDLQSDPFELRNLVSDPVYAKEVERFRMELTRWLVAAGDLGAVPEKELISTMWKGESKPQKTESPTISSRGDKVALACSTEGASLGYKLVRAGSPEPTSWTVYTAPFKVQKGTLVKVMAHRIGYEPAGELMKQF